jgi:hypothetical protein
VFVSYWSGREVALSDVSKGYRSSISFFFLQVLELMKEVELIDVSLKDI